MADGIFKRLYDALDSRGEEVLVTTNGKQELYAFYHLMTSVLQIHWATYSRSLEAPAERLIDDKLQRLYSYGDHIYTFDFANSPYMKVSCNLPFPKEILKRLLEQVYASIVTNAREDGKDYFIPCSCQDDAAKTREILVALLSAHNIEVPDIGQGFSIPTITEPLNDPIGIFVPKDTFACLRVLENPPQRRSRSGGRGGT